MATAAASFEYAVDRTVHLSVGLLKGLQGYAITLAELWEQCRTLQIALPKATPVSAAAMCKARARVHEDMFKDLHAAILKHTDRSAMDPLWHGHRIGLQ